MPKIIFVEHSGAEHVVEAEVGKSVMQVAIDNMVPGILADCGGYCNCATCHCYVDEKWLDSLPAAEEAEQDMLSCAIEPQSNSRLSCQILITPEVDGLLVRLPESQI